MASKILGYFWACIVGGLAALGLLCVGAIVVAPDLPLYMVAMYLGFATVGAILGAIVHMVHHAQATAKMDG